MKKNLINIGIKAKKASKIKIDSKNKNKGHKWATAFVKSKKENTLKTNKEKYKKNGKHI